MLFYYIKRIPVSCLGLKIRHILSDKHTHQQLQARLKQHQTKMTFQNLFAATLYKGFTYPIRFCSAFRISASLEMTLLIKSRSASVRKLKSNRISLAIMLAYYVLDKSTQYVDIDSSKNYIKYPNIEWLPNLF